MIVEKWKVELYTRHRESEFSNLTYVWIIYNNKFGNEKQSEKSISIGRINAGLWRNDERIQPPADYWNNQKEVERQITIKKRWCQPLTGSLIAMKKLGKAEQEIHFEPSFHKNQTVLSFRFNQIRTQCFIISYLQENHLLSTEFRLWEWQIISSSRWSGS